MFEQQLQSYDFLNSLKMSEIKRNKTESEPYLLIDLMRLPKQEK